MDTLLDQKTAAKLLGLSVRTLERHRVAGTGPRFARLGLLSATARTISSNGSTATCEIRPLKCQGTTLG